jgi:phosphohistidine phosphatase
VRLYLVQHGEAKSEAEDPDRSLTDRGAIHVRDVANGATAAGLVTVDRIVHSGKTRARQTAEAWGDALGMKVEESDGLAPNDDPSIWAGRLTGDDVMLVGHLPHLDKITQLLLGPAAEQVGVTFRNGELVGLEQKESGGWTVAIKPSVADSA